MSTSEKENHEFHKIFSQKILTGIKKTGDEVLNSIKNVSQAYWNKVIPTLLNHLIFDLQVAVHNFQQIEIKAKAEKSEKADLQNIINILSKIAHELQEELGKNVDISKSFLEGYVPQIIDAAQSLLEVIEADKLHEYKTEQVELLNALLVATNQISTTLQMEKPEEIKNFVAKILAQFNLAIDEIDFNNPNALDNIRKHTIRCAVEIPPLIHHLYKESNNYSGKLKHEILHAADLIQLARSKITTELKEARDAREAAIYTRYVYNHGCSITIRLIEYLVAESRKLSAPDNLVAIARYMANKYVGLLSRDIEYLRSDTVVSALKK